MFLCVRSFVIQSVSEESPFFSGVRFLTAFGMTRGGVRNDKRGLFALICVHLRNLRSDKPDTTQKKGEHRWFAPTRHNN